MIYFTALFPYVVLVILLVRGLTLDGYMEGVKFYVIPKWNMLLKPQVYISLVSFLGFKYIVIDNLQHNRKLNRYGEMQPMHHHRTFIENSKYFHQKITKSPKYLQEV